MNTILTRIVVPLIVIVMAVACAGLFITMKPSVDKAPVEEVATLVEVMEARPGDLPARIYSTGAVRADQQVTLSPEVAGRVTSVGAELVPGGRVQKGDVLLRVDPRNYKTVVTQRAAQVAQAELDWKLEEGRQVVAQREWELLGGDAEGMSEEVALRKPQLVLAQANLDSARAALAQAKLDLSRTALRAPFNAVVVSESVDVGQVVSTASQAVTLVGTDRARVEVRVPVEQLTRVQVPGLSDGEGSLAQVTQALGPGNTVVRAARVHRLVGQLDTQTRSATLILLIDEPQGGGGLPLLPGAYVSVEIEGTPVEGAVRLPRTALHDGDTVWIVDSTDRLLRRQVKVGFRAPEEVFVTGGLDAGDRVVTSALSMPLPGLKVRLVGSDLDAAVGEEG